MITQLSLITIHPIQPSESPSQLDRPSSQPSMDPSTSISPSTNPTQFFCGLAQSNAACSTSPFDSLCQWRGGICQEIPQCSDTNDCTSCPDETTCELSGCSWVGNGPQENRGCFNIIGKPTESGKPSSQPSENPSISEVPSSQINTQVSTFQIYTFVCIL